MGHTCLSVKSRGWLTASGKTLLRWNEKPSWERSSSKSSAPAKFVSQSASPELCSVISLHNRKTRVSSLLRESMCVHALHFTASLKELIPLTILTLLSVLCHVIKKRQTWEWALGNHTAPDRLMCWVQQAFRENPSCHTAACSLSVFHTMQANLLVVPKPLFLLPGVLRVVSLLK